MHSLKEDPASTQLTAAAAIATVLAELATLALLVLTAHVAPTGQKAVSMWMLEQ
jgi:hypothetical protein